MRLVLLVMLLAAVAPAATPLVELDASRLDARLAAVEARLDAIEASSPGSAPVLPPGTGWDGPTPQPEPIAGLDYPAKPAARWSTIPHQSFAGDFNVSVVAFNVHGVDRVEFAVNGGAWTPVFAMTPNPATGTTEYWATLSGADFTPGTRVEVRARVYPSVGVPRVLAGDEGDAENGEFSLVLHRAPEGPRPAVYVTNDGGDDDGDGTAAAPLATLNEAFGRVEDGGEIILTRAGEYAAPFRRAGHLIRETQRWVTVRPADGLDAADVTLVSPDGTNVQPHIGPVEWRDLTLDWSRLKGYSGRGEAWFNRVRWTSSRGWTDDRSSPVHYLLPYYATNCHAYDTLYGFVNGRIVRGNRVEKISGDALQHARLAVDNTVHHVDGSVLPHHTDMYQMFGEHENQIVYGLTATRLLQVQAFFIEPAMEQNPVAEGLRNSAYVDIHISDQDERTRHSQWMGGIYRNVLFENLHMPEQQVLLRESNGPHQMDAVDLVFRGCTLHPQSYDRYVTNPVPFAGVRFEGVKQ